MSTQRKEEKTSNNVYEGRRTTKIQQHSMPITKSWGWFSPPPRSTSCSSSYRHRRSNPPWFLKSEKDCLSTFVYQPFTKPRSPPRTPIHSPRGVMLSRYSNTPITALAPPGACRPKGRKRLIHSQNRQATI